MKKNKPKRNKDYIKKHIDPSGGLRSIETINKSKTLLSKEDALKEYNRANNAFNKLKEKTCTTSDFDDLANGIHLVKEIMRFVDVVEAEHDIRARYDRVATRLTLVFDTAQMLNGLYLCSPDMFDDIDVLLKYLLKILPRIYYIEYEAVYKNIGILLQQAREAHYAE
jgi:hypothetical protein